MTGGAGGRTAAVVVNYESGPALARCVADLAACGLAAVVVVDNGSTDGSLSAALAEAPGIEVVDPGENLGYGAAANRGVAATASELVLVCNPDLEVPPGAVAALAAALDADPGRALVGPLIRTPYGDRYPSARRFPSMVDAAGHALLGIFAPDNRFTRNYQRTDLDGPATPPWTSTGCRAPASWSDGTPSRRSAGSTSRTSCTRRTSTCAGGWAGPAGGWPTPRPPRSPTSRAAPPTATPTG